MKKKLMLTVEVLRVRRRARAPAVPASGERLDCAQGASARRDETAVIPAARPPR